MAYSRSEETLKTMLPYLSDIALGNPAAWNLPAGDAHKFAYKLREALFISRLDGIRQKYPELAAQAGLVTVEVVNETRVQVKRTGNTPEAAVLSADLHAGNNQGYESMGRSIATVGKQSVFTVIEAWRKHAQQGGSTTPLHFPQAELGDNELFMLYNWAQNWKPRLMLMVDGASLTVGPVEADVEQYAWRPQGAKKDGSNTEAGAEAANSNRVLPDGQGPQVGNS